MLLVWCELPSAKAAHSTAIWLLTYFLVVDQEAAGMFWLLASGTYIARRAAVWRLHVVFNGAAERVGPGGDSDLPGPLAQGPPKLGWGFEA